MMRPGYLRYLDFMTPTVLVKRWIETPCNTPWLFPTESCENYRNLGQWMTADRMRCILGKELSPADKCDPDFDLCPWGHDWEPEVGCVRHVLRT